MVALPGGLQIGDVVAGKYRILRVIGSGAMGVVVAARHLNLDCNVAIKFLLAERLTHGDALARFMAEARTVAKLRSRHIVRVFDVAVLPGGEPYMELEYLEGSDLAARLAQSGRLPVSLAVDFILQACDGIAEAHGLGIIHRDLKPANLFVVPGTGAGETVKVLDFGVSKAEGSVARTLPVAEGAGVTLRSGLGPAGSPCYMSPEQMQCARDVDGRTDVWSLGVTLCELVTGEVPFRGQSLVELYAEIKSRPPLRLRSRYPDLPEGLEAILLDCLEFDRDRRPAGVDDLARRLVTFGSNRNASYVQRIAAPVSVGDPAAVAVSCEASPEPIAKARASRAPEPLVVSASVSRRAARPWWSAPAIAGTAAALAIGLLAPASLFRVAKHAGKLGSPREPVSASAASSLPSMDPGSPSAEAAPTSLSSPMPLLWGPPQAAVAPPAHDSPSRSIAPVASKGLPGPSFPAPPSADVLPRAGSRSSGAKVRDDRSASPPAPAGEHAHPVPPVNEVPAPVTAPTSSTSPSAASPPPSPSSPGGVATPTPAQRLEEMLRGRE